MKIATNYYVHTDQFWYVGHISDTFELEEPLGIVRTATAAIQDMTHGSNQRILEILGARLGGDELSDDELQEASYNV